jgi:outer membrane protein assembly factor BamE (lipoprotein component of BamABCDE complex)
MDPLWERIMTARLKLIPVALLLAISACVSAGTQAITNAGVISRIKVGHSTQAEVAALLGYPLTASYGEHGEATWHYTLVTMAPTVTAFFPAINAFPPSLHDSTQEFSVTFNQDGIVKSLGPGQSPPGSGPPG